MRKFPKFYIFLLLWAILLGIPFVFYDEFPCRSFQLKRFWETNPVNQRVTRKTVKVKQSRDQLPRGNIPYLKTPIVSFKPSCQKDCIRPKWKTVIFVKSHTSNEDRRNLIRKTWASLIHLDGAEFRTIFVVGISNEENEAFLLAESRRHKDILQIKRPDTYKNIVWKTLVGMQWACDHLEDADYFTTADDDVLLNPQLLKKAIEHYKKTYHFTTMPIICMYDLWSYKGTPDRDPLSKYYVSWQQYNGTKWPKFCPGGTYTISIDIAKQMYKASRYVPLLPVDDVWLTGIIRQKIYYYDSMVVAAKPRAAVHFMGFYLKMNEKKFRKDWNDNFSHITSVAQCICHKQHVGEAITLSKEQ